ncbi:MAG: DUF3108 domain-containing protein [Acidobacteriota bacterium]|nr:DUF3108 domain-containing protein [Acidobacteriota bacterium]
MKRLILVFGTILLLLAGNSSAQKEAKKPAPSPLDKLPLATLQRNFPNGFPIPVGEKLEYEVRFSRFPIYATVGIVTFEFLGEAKFNNTDANGSAEPAINGLNVEFKPAPEDQFFRFRASAISKGMLIAIAGVDVKDRFETLVNAEDFAARIGFKELKEGKKHLAQTVLFDAAGKTVKYVANDLNNKQAAPKEKSVVREDGMLDLLSAFYFVRLQKLKEGQLIRFPVNDDGDNFWFDIVVGKPEKLKTDCGKIKTIKIEPKLFGPGQLFSRPGTMTMWLTDDALHIPLKLEAKTSSGLVRAKLMNFKNKCKLIDDEEKPKSKG